MKIEIKTPNFKSSNAMLDRLFDIIQAERQTATIGVTKDIQAMMQAPGRKPSYPIQWDSEKQRRAFFATDGFGGGIPHKRIGDYQAGWKIEPLDNSVRFYNDNRATPFVGGNAFGLVRSGIHKGRWQLTKSAIDIGLQRLPDAHVKATQNAIKLALS